MKFGPRRPSLKGRIAARTSWRRYVRHSLGVKAPHGWGWLTNRRKAAYNRVYNRTTFDLFARPDGRRHASALGGLVLVILMLAAIRWLF